MAAIAARPAAVAARALDAAAAAADRAAPRRACCSSAMAYKPGVADVRESPALAIAEQLEHAACRSPTTTRYVASVRTAAGTELRSRRRADRRATPTS